MPQLGDVPEDPAVGEHDDRTVLGESILEDVLEVIAIIVVGVAEHMDVSEPGVQHVFQGQRFEK